MSLPEITAPYGLPAFLVAQHADEPGGLYADWKPATGHGRRRRVRTSAPRVRQVAWFLTSRQAALVDDWFERDLAAGSREFAAQVAQQGSRTLAWWRAQWVAPPQWAPLGPWHWRLTGQLLLTGEPRATGPVSTSAALELRAALVGQVTYSPPQNAAIEIAVALRSFAGASLEVVVALEAGEPLV